MAQLLVLAAAVIAVAFATAAVAWAAVFLALIKRVPEAGADRGSPGQPDRPGAGRTHNA